MQPGNHGRRGADATDGGVAFSVWAPFPERVELNVATGGRAGIHAMSRKGDGIWTVFVEGAVAGDRYYFRLEGRDRPDPCSRFQPEGVHGPSEVVDPRQFVWRATDFVAPGLSETVLYELHVGTFTDEGTFEAIIPRLPALRELGVTTLELMPVAEFSGARNWGYDGVALYAPQSTYGGPFGLQRLVDAAHQAGLAVLLDVVYNHFGPEGNYLREFGPYFTARYKTPWGDAINYDGNHARSVREYVLQNALAWVTEYRFDGLRLDAVHTLHDHGAVHILRDLTDRLGEASRELERRLLVMAESEENDVRLIQRHAEGGYGLDAVWSDDFHHALHGLLTGERHSYYQDYGSVEILGRAIRHGFAYEGEFSAFRNRPHGSLARSEPTERFVICAQNHDQAGNRAQGERLGMLVPPEAERLSLFLLFLSPGTPLLFMGEEYGEKAPFLYFISHGDPALASAVVEGRRHEFAGFHWGGTPPDPQDPETFARSHIHWAERETPGHRGLLRLTRELLDLRKRLPALRDPSRSNVAIEVDERRRLFCVRRGREGERLLLLCSFSHESQRWEGYLPEGRWEPLLDAGDSRFEGTGATASPLRSGFVEVPLEPFAGKLYREVSG